MKEKVNHPYKDYMQTELWILMDFAVDELRKNQDIELTTKKEYVVGYLCKILKTKWKGIDKSC